MTITMRREPMNMTPAARRARSVVAAAMLMAAPPVSAQTPQPAESNWKLGASIGGYVPLSSLIMAADTRDTQLEAGPAFALDAQYLAGSAISIYLNGLAAFATIQLGSSIQPTVVGPSNQVMLLGGTAGLLLTATDWFDNLQPTLRAGGGFKFYSFDITGADNQLRPTGDIGLGFRGVGIGSIEVTAEARYLFSSFDQSKLPIRGIAPQDQRQNDLMFAIGFGIRP